MNKHKKRNFDFWKKVNERDIVSISGANNQAMALLINAMRGERTLERYAYECKISTSTLYRSFQGTRKKSIPYNILISLYEHKDINCDIDFESLLEANGLMLYEDFKKNQLKIKSCEKACIDLKFFIDLMVGDRSYEKYASECQIPQETIAYIRSLRRKTPLKDSVLQALFDNRDIESLVSMEQLKKANSGFISKDDSYNEQKVVMDVVDPVDIKETEIPQTTSDTYEDFLKDMAFYLTRKPRGILPDIRTRCKDLYRNNSEVKILLRKFRIISENEWGKRMTEMKAFNLFQGDLSDNYNSRSKIIEKELDSLLLDNIA